VVHYGVLPSDDVLVGRLRRGDDAAFELILTAWSPSMLRLARAFVSSGASAEEVVQDAWLAVIRGIDGFQGRASLRTWIFRILVNAAKKRGIRDRRVVPSGSLLAEDLPVEYAGPGSAASRFYPAGDRGAGRWRPERAPQPWSEPESAAEHAETLRVVRDAMTDLPARTRAVLLLRDMEGYTSDEVCELLDISPGNQRVLLHRARLQVRARLAVHFAEPAEPQKVSASSHIATEGSSVTVRVRHDNSSLTR
jgi:RNA polymerase sigma-70 factor (ECF subfamily)